MSSGMRGQLQCGSARHGRPPCSQTVIGPPREPYSDLGPLLVFPASSSSSLLMPSLGLGCSNLALSGGFQCTKRPNCSLRSKLHIYRRVESTNLEPEESKPDTEAMSQLSARGILAQKPGRDDLEQFMKGLSDPFHPVDNKDGYLVLLVAENKLNISMIMKKFKEASECESIPDWVAGYGDMRGSKPFRTALAAMMEETFIKAPVDDECLVTQVSPVERLAVVCSRRRKIQIIHTRAHTQAGCGSILETLAWCLADPGDAVILPAPMYSAFPNDFQARARWVFSPLPYSALPIHLDALARLGGCLSVHVRARARACVCRVHAMSCTQSLFLLICPHTRTRRTLTLTRHDVAHKHTWPQDGGAGCSHGAPRVRPDRGLPAASV